MVMKMEFNEKLKRLRIKYEYSQESLAEELHVSRQAIAKWEAGNGMPDLNNLKAIADLFDVTIDSLIREEEEVESTHDHFMTEFMFAGAGIGAGLGYILREQFVMEGMAGALIGYLLARSLLMMEQRRRNQKKD